MIGAHVRAGATLRVALEHGAAIGAEVIQVFTQSPRAWKPTLYSDDVLRDFRVQMDRHPHVQAVYCHATYLINLASDDPELRERSRACVLSNMAVARGMGASGLVLHVGSHKGAGFDASVVARVADALGAVLEVTTPACPLLIENTAGSGGTIGRTFEELATLLDATLPASHDATALGICLDTQHLWASGLDYATMEAADRLVAQFDAVVGLDRLRCLHVNDSKVLFGANADRHENIGHGTIGSDALGCLLSHPRLIDLPAILEVPGAGQGARAVDIEAVRRARQKGLSARTLS